MQIKNPARAYRSLGSAALAVVLFAGLSACAPAQDAALPQVTPDNGTPAATATKTAEPESIRGTLVEALSGDTVVIAPVGEDAKPNGEPNLTVRVLGISAPKIDECGGPEAVAEFKRAVGVNGFFRVQFDENFKHTNAEGQTVGHLISGDGQGVTGNAAYTMTSNGYASAWHEGDTAPKNFETLVQNTSIAKGQDKGIWASCDTVGLGSSIPAAKKPTGPNS